MIVPAIFAVLAAQAAPHVVGRTLPLAAAQPLLTYVGCLFDSLAEKVDKGLPVARSQREQIVATQLALCSSVKTSSRDKALLAVTSVADKAEVERSLIAAEKQLRFIIVDHEKAVCSGRSILPRTGRRTGMLKVENLHAEIDGKEILKGLTVNGGEVHAIMGPNGAGKSTLSETEGRH